MDRFNKPNVQLIRTEVDAALAAIGARHGIDLKSGYISFTDVSFKMTVNAQIEGLDITDTPEGKAFLAYHQLHGFEATDLGRVVTLGGKRMEFIGFKMDNPKNVCLLREMATDKTYKAPVSSVLHAMKAA